MRDKWLKPCEDDEDDEDNENRDSLLKAAYAPYDFHFKQYLGWDSISTIAHVTVDLCATDEQIESDFSHWLLHYRTATGHCVPKKKTHEKLFTQEVFNTWIKNRLVPYLDLKLIAEIEGKTITQEDLGVLLFPDKTGTDIEIKMSQTVKPDAEELIKKENLSLLVNQLMSMKRKNTKRYNYERTPNKK